jgi:hypothetical protein
MMIYLFELQLRFGGCLISRKETAVRWPPFLFFG